MLGNHTVIIQGVLLKVESECSVQLETLGDTECKPIRNNILENNNPSPTDPSLTDSGPTIVGAVLGTVGGVLLIVGVLAITVVAVLLCVRRRLWHVPR